MSIIDSSEMLLYVSCDNTKVCGAGWTWLVSPSLTVWSDSCQSSLVAVAPDPILEVRWECTLEGRTVHHGHNVHKHTRSFTPRCKSSYTIHLLACFWELVGNWTSQGKPTRTQGEYTQKLHTQLHDPGIEFRTLDR